MSKRGRSTDPTPASAPWYRRPAALIPLALVAAVVVALVAVAVTGEEPSAQRPQTQDGVEDEPDATDDPDEPDEVDATDDPEDPDDADEPVDEPDAPDEDAPTVIPEGRAGLGMETSSFTVALSWENEVDDDADPARFRQGQEGATGTAVLRLASAHGLICADITVEGLDEGDSFEDGPGAHLHQGGLGETGPIAVSFATPDDETGQSSGCFREFEDGFDPDETLRMIEENPSDWYVNVHSAAFPAGVVRGQLPDGGQDELPSS